MKIGHVEIPVQQYADGRWGFDDYSKSERRMVRVKTKQKAEARAIDIAVMLANGRGDLLQVDQHELAEFRKWKSICKDSPPLGDACAEFIRLKSRKSTDHVQCLRDNLKLFEEFIGARRPLATIMALEIQRFLDSRDVGDRRKHNLRSSVVALFRWARRMSYLHQERITEAEKVEPIEIEPGQVNVLTPDQMRSLIENIKEKFLPWLLIAGFSGIRSGEIVPCRQSKKSPLMWEDFDWRHRVIIVRAATAKNKGREREVPITSNLAEWLAPWRNAKGPVIACKVLPSRRETKRLGKLIGGWKNNCLRDSFCSYRARITQNVPQVSYEMGNSIAMVKRSYHRRQPIRAAREWFKIRPAREPFLIGYKPKKYQKVSNRPHQFRTIGASIKRFDPANAILAR
jgi:integrase